MGELLGGRDSDQATPAALHSCISRSAQWEVPGATDTDPGARPHGTLRAAGGHVTEILRGSWQPGGAVGGPPGRANPPGQPRITARQRAALRVESLWITSWDRRITGRKTQLDSDHVLLESLLRALWRKEAGPAPAQDP